MALTRFLAVYTVNVHLLILFLIERMPKLSVTGFCRDF
jgi:hypothetical protein